MTTSADATIRAGGPRPDLDARPNRLGFLAFFLLLAGGVGFTIFSLSSDLGAAHVAPLATTAIVLLGVALLVALGFEFVNGFHDTANAVATVIYTNTMPPTVAVVWSGCWNFLGVLTASGAVAYGIISLLPVELILGVGRGAGFAMVFALLIAAILWNLGTWYLGLPSSSSHTLIGSIIGVGLANQLMHASTGTSGVDWSKAREIGMSLLISPAVGFIAAALLLLLVKALVKAPALYREPVGDAPPPWWIRGLLVLTCTLVSFFHGSNDGQKGMGLIMLILIGTVPTAYALNRVMPEPQVAAFATLSRQAQVALATAGGNRAAPADPRATLTGYLQSRTVTPETLPALAAMAGRIGEQMTHYRSMAMIPTAATANVRNDLYVASEALRILDKDPSVAFDAATKKTLGSFRKGAESATRYIPDWVKAVIAIALGLGTMVGWKRIVVTVGEKIGKTHLTYAQGASAELVAAAAIGVADNFGLPVSTTHVLSSGVAGTMAANGSGLQMTTLRNLALAWVLTLPASILIAGTLYWVFSQFI